MQGEKITSTEPRVTTAALIDVNSHQRNHKAISLLLRNMLCESCFKGWLVPPPREESQQMAGLGVLLEAQHRPLSKGLQIINKFTLVSCSSASSTSSPSPHPHPPPMPTSSFLESCFLCGKHLSQGRDIYMYRGDRAFCSVECRCRHITMDEQSMKREKCGDAASRHRGKAASRGFTY